MAEAAEGVINLELHSGAHPRLGVVDDIAFHPLAEASLDEAAWLAKAAAADFKCQYFFMVLHIQGAGPRTQSGVKWVTIGQISWAATDVLTARWIASMVSASGGGLPSVQSLALFHGDDSTEIACMLLEPNRIGTSRVQARVEMLAAQEGLEVEKGYFTDLSPEMIVRKYMNLISSRRD